MPAETFTHSTPTSAPPAMVYAALQDPETWKGIGPIDDVWAAARAADGSLTGFRWRARAAGRDWDGSATRSSHEPDRSMTLDLDSPEVGGNITVTIVAANPGSTLTVTMTARSKGFLAGMFWGIIADALRAGLPAQVDGFGARF